MESAGRGRGLTPGCPVCADRNHCAGKDCRAPRHGRGPPSTSHPVGFYAELSLGPTSPPCPTWWSPHSETQADSRGPSSTSGLHMGLVLPGGRGKVTSGGEIGGPQGASDPQGRVSEPLKHMTRAAGWSETCPPELRAALGRGWGEWGLALQSLWAAAPAPARILPTARLPEQPSFWGSAPDAPLPPALTPKPHSHGVADATFVSRMWRVPARFSAREGIALGQNSY